MVVMIWAGLDSTLYYMFWFWCSKYGHVQDVRIPCQQKRMFGFVTFTYAETVKEILSKGNPHSVCGARVLVKPYREKPRLFERLPLIPFQNHQRTCPIFCISEMSFLFVQEECREITTSHALHPQFHGPRRLGTTLW